MLPFVQCQLNSLVSDRFAIREHRVRQWFTWLSVLVDSAMNWVNQWINESNSTTKPRCCSMRLSNWIRAVVKHSAIYCKTWAQDREIENWHALLPIRQLTNASLHRWSYHYCLTHDNFLRADLASEWFLVHIPRTREKNNNVAFLSSLNSLGVDREGYHWPTPYLMKSMNQRICSHHPSLLGYSLVVLAVWPIVWPMSSNSRYSEGDFRFAAPTDRRLDWVQAKRNVMHVWNNKRKATFGRHRITEEFLRLEDEQMERP